MKLVFYPEGINMGFLACSFINGEKNYSDTLGPRIHWNATHKVFTLFGQRPNK